MSMDEVHRELMQFRRELERFHGSVRSSLQSLEREHDRVNSMWRDSFRKDYDRQWADFGKHMDSYLARDAEKYMSFLSSKINQVEAYLRG